MQRRGLRWPTWRAACAPARPSCSCCARPALWRPRSCWSMRRRPMPVLDANGQFCGYRGSARDVTQSVQAKAEMWQREHELAQMTLAKEEAEAASRAKSVLVSKVGHELRTPLNAIVGLAQLIRA